jgi:hypothetical protein
VPQDQDKKLASIRELARQRPGSAKTRVEPAKRRENIAALTARPISSKNSGK